MKQILMEEQMNKFDQIYNKLITQWNRKSGDWDDYGEARHPGERYNGEKWKSRAWSHAMNQYWDGVREQRRKQNAQIKQDRESGFQNIPIYLRDTWRAWWDFYSFSCRTHKFSQIYEKLPTVQNFESELDKSRAKLVPGANVNLAIKGYKDMKPQEDLLIFPYTIIDKVEDGIVEFHIDPKKYRELKELNYQVKTTNVELRYLKSHPQDQKFKNAHPFGDSLDKSNTTGIQIKKLYNLWYKIYGKEQGQLFHFRVPLKGVAVYEDVISLWDKIIKEYLEARDKNE